MNTPSRWLIFSPYMDALAGGERYVFSLANALQLRYSVTIGCPRPPSIDELRRFGFDESLSFCKCTLLNLGEVSCGYDGCIQVTNRTPVETNAKRNFVHVQFPYENLDSDGHKVVQLFERVLVNSEFTRRWVDVRWGCASSVLYPAARLGTYHERSKRRAIVSVGRFTPGGIPKRQDVLIRAFRQLIGFGGPSFELWLVGRDRDADYVAELKRLAVGLPVNVIPDAPQEQVWSLYASSQFFWHACGFHRTHDCPERAEHFGIATVEAMSYGCVPLVYADGGQVEVLDADSGFTWNTLDELVERTLAMREDTSARIAMARHATARSRLFTAEHFDRRLFQILDSSRKI